MPLYVLGHNTNAMADVHTALESGANALEVDVTAYEFDLSQLCVDHAGVTGDSPGRATAPRLADFLSDLRQVAGARPELALVVFDCKPPAATPALGPAILESVRRGLSEQTGVNVILSIASHQASTPYKLDGTTMFDQIAGDLRPREGVMIDEIDNPEQVAAFFNRLGASRNCYGYGTSSPVSDAGAMVYRLPVERACWMRVAGNQPRFVYAWTVNDDVNQHLYLRIGVNGIISDPSGIAQFAAMLRQPEFASLYRLATRLDNPFIPSNAAYGLTVRTSDIAMAGTDAGVTLKVTGSLGSSTVTVEGKYNGRVERNSTNYLVLPSPDLGTLETVSVRQNGGGNAPDWHLQSVAVESQRYGTGGTAQFDCWIPSDVEVARQLV
jgi:PLAT/LH2 domain-containing protein